ncbi:uncharacterized protein [Amphiura filiformis]|uniref:uncharacterized protein n=1 Tax=Amphiura filiformis TaxID=82378 RepID=UPI003B21FEEF
MDDPKRWTISSINRKLIVTDVYVEQIKDHMMQGGIMECADFETIQNSGKNHKAWASAFLDILVTRGSLAFDTFCEALDDNRQSHISEKLRHDSTMLANQITGNKVTVDASTLQKLLQQNDELRESRNKTVVMEKELVTLEKRNVKLSNKLNKVRRKSNELWEENNTVRGKHEESQKILNTVTQFLEDSKSHVKELKNEKNNLERRVAELETQLKLQDAELRIVEQERKELEDHALEQELEWSYQTGIISDLKQAVTRKDDEMKEMSQKHQADVAGLQESIQHYNQNVTDLENELADVRRKLQEIETEKIASTAMNKQQEECIFSQENKITQLTKHLNDIKHGLAQMKDTITQITDEKKVLQQMVIHQESIIKRLNTNLDNHSKLSNNREMIIQHLNWRIHTLLSDKDLAEKEVISANQNLQQILLQHINLAQTVLKTQSNQLGHLRCLKYKPME